MMSNLFFHLLYFSSLPLLSLQNRFAQPRVGYACEGSTLTIQCGPGRHIQIRRAIFGRFSISICNNGRSTAGWNLQCMSLRAPKIISRMCRQRNSCSVPADHMLFGDPCSTTDKYLEIAYTCSIATTEQPTTQEKITTSVSTGTTSQPKTTVALTTSTTAEQPLPTTQTEQTTRKREPPTDAHCPEVQRRNISWPRAAAGEEIVKPCPNNRKTGSAVWMCTADGWLKQPDLSKCVSKEVSRLNMMLDEGQRPDRVASEVRQLSKRPLYGGDLRKMVGVMKNVVKRTESKPFMLKNKEEDRTQIVESVSQDVIQSTSNMIARDRRESWQDLPADERRNLATEVIETVEDSANMLSNSIKKPKVVVNVDVNIVLEVNVVDTVSSSTPKDVVFPNSKSFGSAPSPAANSWAKDSNSIKISGNEIKRMGVNGLAKLIFLTYKNIDEFMNPNRARISSTAPTTTKVKYMIDKQQGEFDRASNNIPMDEGIKYDDKSKAETDEQIVNSNIISASINGRKDRIMLKDPVLYTLEHKTTDNVYNPTCSFWDYSEKNMLGEWSSFGCKVESTNLTHTTCSCNHLTNFAVLMSVRSTPLSNEHSFALSLITYAGILISLVCLILSFITFSFFKNLQCDRNTIHKNLVLCLFIAELVFLTGIMQSDKPPLCMVIAMVLHYFFLASFAWMLLEGIQLYVMLIEVFESEHSRMKYYYISAYGSPLVIVIISVAVDYTGYGTNSHCWLSVVNGFVWSFIGPAIVVITINVAMLSLAIYMMCKHAKNSQQWKTKEKSRFQKIRSWILGSAILVVLLGLTWGFGILYVNAETIFWAYLFTILNTLQGLFIFIFHCLCNEKVQKEYKRAVRHAEWLPECIRVQYGGTKTQVGSTTPQSTSSVNYIQKLRKRLSTSSLRKNSSCTPPPKIPALDGLKDANQPTFVHRVSSVSPSEDPQGYLIPSDARGSDPPDVSTHGTDGIMGADLSVIDASVVDSNYVSDYCQQQQQMSPLPTLDIEKYKIRTPDGGVCTESQQQQLGRAPSHDRMSELTLSDKNSVRGADYSSSSSSDEESDGLDNDAPTAARLKEKMRLLDDYPDNLNNQPQPQQQPQRNAVASKQYSTQVSDQHASLVVNELYDGRCYGSPAAAGAAPLLLNNLNKPSERPTPTPQHLISAPNISPCMEEACVAAQVGAYACAPVSLLTAPNDDVDDAAGACEEHIYEVLEDGEEEQRLGASGAGGGATSARGHHSIDMTGRQLPPIPTTAPSAAAGATPSDLMLRHLITSQNDAQIGVCDVNRSVDELGVVAKAPRMVAHNYQPGSTDC